MSREEQIIILPFDWDAESKSLQAKSIFYADMDYSIERIGDAEWTAYFDGYPLASGSLQDCIAACLESEMEGQKEYAKEKGAT